MKVLFRPFEPNEAALLAAATGCASLATVDFEHPRWLCCSAYVEGRLAGVACFEFKNWFDPHFSIAVKDPRCATRRLLTALFSVAFTQARRITVLIRPENARAIKAARGLGFKDEGFLRLAIEGRYDALLLGMLPEDCRYLQRTPRASSVAQKGAHHGLNA